MGRNIRKICQYKQTKQTSNMKQETKAFLDSLLPTMTPTQQKKMLHQLVKEANEDSRKQAILDPLSRIAMA
jgi:hypothetical protein